MDDVRHGKFIMMLLTSNMLSINLRWCLGFTEHISPSPTVLDALLVLLVGCPYPLYYPIHNIHPNTSMV
jgi:hypothetical protein